MTVAFSLCKVAQWLVTMVRESVYAVSGSNPQNAFLLILITAFFC